MRLTFTKILALVTAVCFTLSTVNAQLTTISNSNAAQIAQSLVGAGIQIFNPTKTGNDSAIAMFFNGATTNLGMNSGVILSTGKASQVPGNPTFFASTSHNGAGDAMLTNTINAFNTTPGLTLATNDAMVLEFDLRVDGDSLKFDYIFGSEEYTSFVCTQFTDVFAFYISGPNPAGGNYTNQNIALIPNSTTPVAINSVNGGNSSGTNTPCILNNTQYYVNNGGTSICLDGFTTLLRAQIATTPCQIYHLKLAIADVGDWSYDSKVFLKANSFSATNVTISPQTSVGNGFNNAIESCVDGQFRFTINPTLSTPYTINYTLGGTAIGGGVDYVSPSGSVIVPAGDSIAVVPIPVIADGINEGTETVKLYLLNTCTGLPYDSATLLIKDSIAITASASDYFICRGESTTLTVGGALNYTWAPAGSIAQPTATNQLQYSTLATPQSTQIYSVTASVSTCQSIDTLLINVSDPNFTTNLGPDDTICANQTVILPLQINTIVPPITYTYQWTPTTYMGAGNSTLQQPTVTPLQTTQYRVAVNASNGCTLLDTINIVVNGVGPQVTAYATPSTICPGQQVQLNFSSSPNTCGANAVGCFGLTKIDSVGSGYNVTAGSPTQYPAVYGAYARSARHQMLYTAAEINAAFQGGGTITQIAWEIGTFASNAQLQNFTIRIKCVPASTTTLVAYQNTGFTTVFTGNVTPATGWNVHNFTTPYDWDGLSNILVDICYSNTTSGTLNNRHVYTTTPTNRLLSSSSNTDICMPTTSTPAGSTQRPKARFTICQPDYNNLVVSWTPASGPNAVSDPIIRNPTANPTTTQQYNVTVSQNGCQGNNFVTVTVNAPAVNAGPDVSLCSGGSTTLNATPSTPGSYTYQWTTLAGTLVSNTQTASVSPAATTSYRVSLNNGSCTTYDTVVVSIGSLQIDTNVYNITCNGAANGAVVAIPAGATPYTYAWSANAGAVGSVDSIFNLAPGNYSVTVTDNVNCTGTITVPVTQPLALTLTEDSMYNARCFGGSDGAIFYTANGGTLPYTYAWTGTSSTGPSAVGLDSNTYSITVTDANTCTATATQTVVHPNQMVIDTVMTKNIRCLNGTDGIIELTTTGGTGTYTYQWSPNTTFSGSNATNLAAGTYNITALDIYNCTATASYTLTQPPTGVTFNPAVVNDALCFGSADGNATINPTGGVPPYTYQWTNTTQTTQTITGLTAQTYNVTVSDDSLCTATSSVTVNQPTAVTVQGAITNVSCNGGNNGAINLTPAGGTPNYAFVWSNGPVTEDINTLTAGLYSVTVYDSHQCSVTAGYNVTEPVALSLNAPNIHNVSCLGGNDGRIKANPAGGTTPYSYAWSVPGTLDSIMNLAIGNYNVTVTDANGCTITATYNITEPATAVAFGNPVINPVNCFGGNNGSIAVSVSGGTPGVPAYHYTWSHDALLDNATATSLVAGNYTVTAADGNGCTATATYSVTQPTAITFGASTVNNVSCFGGSDGSIEVFPSGGTGAYTYSFNSVTGPNPATGLTANAYTIVVTDANNCTASTTATINQPNAITINFNVQMVTCSGANDGSITAIPAGGTGVTTLLWSNTQTTTTISGLAPGSYTVTVTDANSCTAANSTSVNEPAPLTISLASTQVSCVGTNDGTITASGNGGTTPFTFELISGGTTIQTSNTGAFIGLTSGTFTVKLTDANGCNVSDNIDVASPIADVHTVAVTPTSCYGNNYNDGVIDVTSGPAQNGPFMYSLDGGNYQNIGLISNVSAGIHSVTVRNNFGCDTVLSIIVPEPVAASVDITPQDTAIDLGQDVQLSSVFGPYPASTINYYQWSPSAGLSCSDCPNPVVTSYNPSNVYTLTVHYNNTCYTSNTVTIFVENNLPVFIPNAFTPNGDGSNDIFQVFGQAVKGIDLQIFNRWGEKVFQSFDQFQGWDGTYKGELVPPGVFTYQIKVTWLDDKTIFKKGTLTVLR
jgi:gliding motility-associated-like protein